VGDRAGDLGIGVRKWQAVNRRPALSTLLFLGGIVLLISIAIGNSMGNHVLGQVGERLDSSRPTPVVPVPDESDTGAVNWKKVQVMSVATDPAFPDPRITPSPQPSPTAVPLPTPPPTPAPLPTQEYTSPPLAIPLVSHTPIDGPSDPDATPSPEHSTKPGERRPGPAVTPIEGPTLNP
jgi:hypothetical protein